MVSPLSAMGGYDKSNALASVELPEGEVGVG